MINYSKGVEKTNESIKKMNQKGKKLMGNKQVQVKHAANTKNKTK